MKTYAMMIKRDGQIARKAKYVEFVAESMEEALIKFNEYMLLATNDAEEIPDSKLNSEILEALNSKTPLKTMKSDVYTYSIEENIEVGE